MSNSRAASITQPLLGARVLMVDDSPDGLEPACILLNALGADVRCLGSAAQALQEAPAFAPTVLVLDLALPDTDGFELLQRLRELSPEIAAVPAVAFSADARSEAKARATAAGFVRYITKPAEPFALVGAVADLGGPDPGRTPGG